MNVKRSLSESEDDFDDIKDGSPSQSCQVHTRKKRRGVIEKRRRDRINNSLTELRRLVPTAFEKQGSAKLEKAEILQMTVDHLKLLHQKGLNGYNIDPASLAMDYRGVGFRECAAEVARYLVTVEGMDLQDPLRLRLMSHLQCYSAQREAAAKVGSYSSPAAPSAPSAWNSIPTGLNPQYPPTPTANPNHMGSTLGSSVGLGGNGGSVLGGAGPNGSTHPMLGHQQDSLSSLNSSQQHLTQPSNHQQQSPFASPDSSTSRLGIHSSQQQDNRLPALSSAPASTLPSALSTSSTMTLQNSPPSALSAQFHSSHLSNAGQFQLSAPPFGMSGTAAVTPSMLSPGMYQSAAGTLGQLKPYRPWGTELAY